nr:hypothetical protein BaRGS_014657 [Batillaria attramentaria]KAG5701474.1 hypothetical protein BaRGS_000870 [Batillaria attramentaria]
MTSQLLFGPGSLTQAQVISFSLVAAVLITIIGLNIGMCYLYRRVRSEDQRRAVKAQKKKMSDVWVYHVHRPDHHKPSNAHVETADEQILRKLRASHENLRASLAESAHAQQGTFGQEENQALEELDVMNDLFLLDDSCSTSRRSSVSESGSFPVGVSDRDSISLSSVKMSDFQNDPDDMMGLRKSKKKGRRGRRSRGSGENDALPVAEFHNEAFDFVESTAAVERVNDVEL